MIESEVGTCEEVLVPDAPPEELEELQERARAAEERASESEARIAELEAQLAGISGEQEQEASAHEMQSLLCDAGAIDLEAASILAAGLIDCEELSPAQAVATLKREKAFLFAAPARSLSAMSSGGRFASELESVASAARSSGNRRELLHYMRLRRNA